MARLTSDWYSKLLKQRTSGKVIMEKSWYVKVFLLFFSFIVHFM